MIGKKTIRKVVRGYNRYRVPMVEASLIGTRRNNIIMRFSGDFCRTPGFSDYFDDFKVELQKETGHPIKVKEVIPKGGCNFTAVFSVTPLVGFSKGSMAG